ncbi:MAG: hypothetical protein AB1791_04500, partial [Chloroflexota bacterium]
MRPASARQHVGVPPSSTIISRLCRAVIALEGMWLALILPAVILITPSRALILLVIPLIWLARKLAYGAFVP